MLRTYSGLGDEQANRREGKVRYMEAILMDRDSTGIRVVGGGSGGVHKKGRQRDVVKRRTAKGIEWETGQDRQVGLDPEEGLEAGGRSTKLLEEKFITRELNQYGGC